MYIIARNFKVEKNFAQPIIDRFSNPTLISKFKGFVKVEVQANLNNQEFDFVRVVFYFESKKAYFAWEGSPEHIASHKNRKPEDKPQGIIEVTFDKLDLVSESFYDGE